ncbi:hypothetical protein ACIQNU_09590 [Streptomyces sp. NPDC091292]|uniref:hypothetical protein n=1 Tax=Streptomyces sp. NPDC091292 TaxID=3365991 RepID=UPI0037FC8F58
MRTIRISVRSAVRSGLTATAAAALPLTLAAPAFAGGTAVSGITVTAAGSTVQVSTVACTTGGYASLLSTGQTTFAQGRQISLSGGTASQSGSWSNVGPGTYNVSVLCANGINAGTRTVTVGAAPTVAPTISATTAPARGVQGGLGGGTENYDTLTKAGGGALVGAGIGGTVWYLRRRSRHQRH